MEITKKTGNWRSTNNTNTINPVERFIGLFASQGVVLSTLLGSSLITVETVIKVRNSVKWDWGYLSRSSNISIHDLLGLIETLEIPKTTSFRLSRQSQITIGELISNDLRSHITDVVDVLTTEEYLKYFHNDGELFMHRGLIRESDLDKYPQIKWEYKYLINNRNLSLKFLLGYRRGVGARPYTPDEIVRVAMSGDVTEYCTEFIDFTYGHEIDCRTWRYMSLIAPFELILESRDLGWDWRTISDERSFDMSTILKYRLMFGLRLRLCDYGAVCVFNDVNSVYTSCSTSRLHFMQSLYDNGKLTIYMVKSNPKLDWNVRALAMCESISIRDLIDHFDANSIEPTAVMKELSKRHDLDLQTILEYCHLPWVFYPGETGKWFRELMGISS